LEKPIKNSGGLENRHVKGEIYRCGSMVLTLSLGNTKYQARKSPTPSKRDAP